MKKVLLVLLSVLLVFSMVGCTSGEKAAGPEDTVKVFMDAVKNNDATTMNKCMEEASEEDGLLIRSDDFFEGIAPTLIKALKEIKYTVDPATVNGDKATVKVNVEYVDLDTQMRSLINDYSDEIDTDKYDDSTVDELVDLFNDYLRRIDIKKAGTLTETLEFTLVNTKGGWKISEYDDDFYYVVTAEALETMYTMMQIFNGEDEYGATLFYGVDETEGDYCYLDIVGLDGPIVLFNDYQIGCYTAYDEEGYLYNVVLNFSDEETYKKYFDFIISGDDMSKAPEPTRLHGYVVEVTKEIIDIYNEVYELKDGEYEYYFGTYLLDTTIGLD